MTMVDGKWFENDPATPGATRCMNPVRNRSWNQNSTPMLCGKTALWLLSEGDGTTLPICGSCKYRLTEQRSYRRIDRNLVTPIDPNGCPFCARPLKGVAPNRKCSHGPCMYDEAERQRQSDEAAEAEAERVERLKLRPFDPSMVVVPEREVEYAVSNLRRALVQATHDWSDHTQEQLAKAKTEVTGAIEKLQAVLAQTP